MRYTRHARRDPATKTWVYFEPHKRWVGDDADGFPIYERWGTTIVATGAKLPMVYWLNMVDYASEGDERVHRIYRNGTTVQVVEIDDPAYTHKIRIKTRTGKTRVSKFRYVYERYND